MNKNALKSMLKQHSKSSQICNQLQITMPNDALKTWAGGPSYPSYIEYLNLRLTHKKTSSLITNCTDICT